MARELRATLLALAAAGGESDDGTADLLADLSAPVFDGPQPGTANVRPASRAGRGPAGKPLMPWQQQVVDTALEVDPDTGLLAYREVVLTVPRQAGETLLGLAVKTHRCLGFGEPQNVLYTAQDRIHALAKWEDDQVPALQASPLSRLFTVRRQRGQEAIRWANGSRWGDHRAE